MVEYTLNDLKIKSINSLIEANERFIIVADDDDISKEEEDKEKYVRDSIAILRERKDSLYK